MLSDVKIETISCDPIYRQIADILKNNIISGKLPSGTQLPPEPILAAKFNTSRLTLRKSLNILEDQKLLVQRKGRGTFITYQSLKKYRIAISGIGLATEDPFNWHVFGGISQALVDIEKEFVFIDNSGDVLDKFHHSRCDGLIAVAPGLSQIAKFCTTEFDSIPLVLLNVQDKKISKRRVCVDVEKGSMRTAMEHLSKLGHRRIAYITREGDEFNQRDRNASFVNSIKELDLDNAPDLYQCGVHGVWFYDIGRDHALKLCQMSNLPTAIVCPNQTIALGAWQGIIESGLKIPEDISIIGYDVPEWANPYLATLVQPEIKMAEAAGALLLEQLRGGTVQNQEMIFKIMLEERKSCAPPRKR